MRVQGFTSGFGLGWLAFLVAMLSVTVVAGAEKVSKQENRLQKFRARYHERFEQFRKSLETLATWCEENGLAEPAARTRELAQPFDPEALRLMPVVEESPPAEADQPESALEGQWKARLAATRKRYAEDLFTLARNAYKAGLFSLAYDLCRETVEHDPAHPGARRVLGYVPYGQGWVKPYAASMLRQGHVWTDRWGWVARNHLSRYEEGLRPLGRRWVPAAEADAFHADWTNAWTIRTEHYEVRTNQSLERGVSLAGLLEKLHEVFFRLFVGYFTPREQMAVLFEGGGSRRGRADRPTPYRVNYFRDRAEYLRHLAGLLPGQDMKNTGGVYITGLRQAFFFYDERIDQWVLLHEATHQLFQESKPNARPYRSQGNFWVVEGVACYMELLTFNEREARIDWPASRRLAAARQLSAAGRHLPISRFVTLDMERFQSGDADNYYAEAAALTCFFMHFDDGRYRDAFVEYLQRVYEGQADAQTLAQLMETSYEELEREYRRFLEAPAGSRSQGPGEAAGRARAVARPQPTR